MVNVLELERLAWPMTSFAVTVFSAACTIVALATPAWVQLDVFRDQNFTGTVSFGLIRGSDDYELTTSRIDESYYIFSRYNGTVPLEAFYVIIALLGISALLSIPTLFLTFMNSYQVVERWWRGPATVYMLSLTTALIEGIAMAAFVDFYLYDLETGIDIVNIPIEDVIAAKLDYLTSSPNLNYAAYLGFAGTILQVISMVLMWRLTVVLPEFYTDDVLERLGIDVPILDFEMQETNSHEEHRLEMSSEETSSEETDNPLAEEQEDDGYVFTSGMGGFDFY